MTRSNAQARSRLNTRLNQFGEPADAPVPHRGWIRAIRDAVGMSSIELARRLGVRQQSVLEIEESEMRGTIKLETLRRAADALDCDLVYALKPRKRLDDLVASRARSKARGLISRVAHHSRLEDQSVSWADTEEQIDDLAAQLIDRRGLWSDDAL